MSEAAEAEGESCQSDHDWNAMGRLALIVNHADLALGSLFPVAPTPVPVDYCRRCGTLRIPQTWLAALLKAGA